MDSSTGTPSNLRVHVCDIQPPTQTEKDRRNPWPIHPGVTVFYPQNSKRSSLSKDGIIAGICAVTFGIAAGAAYLAINGQLKPLAAIAATKLSPLATAAMAQITLPVILGVGLSAVVIVLLVRCCSKKKPEQRRYIELGSPEVDVSKSHVKADDVQSGEEAKVEEPSAPGTGTVREVRGVDLAASTYLKPSGRPPIS